MAAKNREEHVKIVESINCISYAINNLKSSGEKIIITGYIMNVFGYVINCPSKMFGFSFFSASSYIPDKKISLDSYYRNVLLAWNLAQLYFNLS